MIRFLALTLVLFTLFLCTVQAESYVELTDRFTSAEHHIGPRLDASFELIYDAYTRQNDVYLYGGRSKNGSSEIFTDYHGDVWLQWIDFNIDENKAHWVRLQTDPFKLRDLEDDTLMQQDEEYPPLPRYGHAGIICPALDNSILHNSDDDTQPETYINYIVFGGSRQQVRNSSNLVISGNEIITNEIYVFAEYKFHTSSGAQTRYHWYQIEPEITSSQGQPVNYETWPNARKYAQIVPLFNEQDPIEQRNKFLLFGGIDSNGNICTTAYVGTFHRNKTTPAAPDDNEWTFLMDLDVDFELVTLTNGNLSLYGAEAIYDPYFSDASNPVPRVVVMGGNRISGASDEVLVLTSNNGDWSDITVDSTELPDFNESASGHERAFFSASLDYREGKIRITGGENSSGIIDETGHLMLMDSQPEWTYVQGSSTGNVFPKVSHHESVFSGAEIVLCADDWNTTPVRKQYWDKSSMEPSKTWEVKKNGNYGQTNPEAVTNTRRLGSGDTVKIYQTHNYENAVNDAYKCRIEVPAWCKDITIEGVVYNGVKPLLYQRYNASTDMEQDWALQETLNSKLIRYRSTIVYANTELKLKNLKFCHLDFDVTDPQTAMPTAIPTNRLTAYTSNQSPDGRWYFIHHHADDPAVYMHSFSTIENCEFEYNGVGITMICVSSASSSAEVRNCTFNDNFIGIVALEKDHTINYCRFEDNLLAGLALDKGNRSVIRENLFINNGTLNSTYGLGYYQSGLLVDFSTTSFVPKISTPFIYNNTFDSNYRAMSITEYDYFSQYMNRPIFFNNIIHNPSSNRSSIYVMDCEDRCDLICMNNCFNLANNTKFIELQSSSMNGMVTQSNLEVDPLLQLNHYTLSSQSPCVDAGLHLLEPGITSARSYPDFMQMDIGYHYPLYTGDVPDPPENLSLTTGMMISLLWDSPDPAPDNYYVLVEHDNGDIVPNLINGQSNSFDYYRANDTHLWFGIMSLNNQQIYSDCAWIEWME